MIALPLGVVAAEGDGNGVGVLYEVGKILARVSQLRGVQTGAALAALVFRVAVADEGKIVFPVGVLFDFERFLFVCGSVERL